MQTIAKQVRQVPTMQEIKQLQEIVSIAPQIELPLKHHHSVGAYVREIFMPAGSVVIGKEHATRHLNIVVSGKCTVWTVDGKHVFDAKDGPITFESMAGVKKVLYMHTNVVWMTVHPTDETDPDRLENIFIRPEEQLSLFPELDMDVLALEIFK